MRIDFLDLMAFGPFSGTRLDFGAKPRALQLVYGPNEAGKSTTLRALIALLYGIPERTGDAHLHEMGKLRLGAILRDEEGKRLSVMRRKGRKHTLLDAEERPLDEGILRRMLGGLDEGLYRQLFGLDHERLRLGAEALLQGGGGLGEGLFDAGTGGRTIHTALQSLRAEADALYRPKGQRKLNVALNALRERQKERKEAMLSPHSFEEQRRALEQAVEQRDALRKQRALLFTEQSELSLSLRALPFLSQRAQLQAARAELGPVRAISVEALEQAKGLGHERTELLAELSRLDAQRVEALRLREALPPPDALRIGPELSRELTERLGRMRSAERELPRLRGELDSVTRDTNAIRARIGQNLDGALQLDVARRARLRQVAEEVRVAEGERLRAEREHAATEALLTQLRARLTELGEPVSTEELVEHVSNHELQSFRGELNRLNAQIAQREQAIQQGLVQLGLSFEVASLSRLTLPFPAELEACLEAIDGCERQLVELVRKREQLASDRATLERDMALSCAEGEPVTEDDLAEARSLRERFWTGLAADLRGGTPPVSADRLRAFEAAQRASDRVADRLRTESGRAGLVMQQRARLSLLDKEAQRLDETQQRLTQAHRELLDRLSSLWTPSGIELRAPKDMLLVRERLAKLVVLASEQQALLLEQASLHGRLEQLRSGLLAELRRLGESEPQADAALDGIVRTARALIQREAARALTCQSVSQEHERAERSWSEQAARLAGLTSLATELRAQLGQELSAIGLSAQLSAHEALACLEELVQLEAREREALGMAQRIAALSEEQRQFEDDVRRLVEGKDVPEHLSLSELVTHVTDRAERAREVERDRARLSEQIDGLSTQLSGLKGKLDSYAQSFSTLLSQLGATDPSELSHLQAQYLRSEELRRAEEQNEAELSTLAVGADLVELAARVNRQTPAQARVRLQEIEAELESLDEQTRDVDQRIGGLGVGVTTLTESEGAGPRAEEAESELANVQQLARRYIEVKLALSILSREVERYREAHQGPVLQRASVLFPRLTLERYRGLDVDYGDDDHPRLCAVRDDGVRVHVEGLSDGTRDQLYLALRVASLERFLTRNPPLPIVLDDILVHFDDARSEAALRVLSELAGQTQVLFFTHHARIVELAKRTLSSNQLCVHTLRGPDRGARAIRDDGPLFDRGG